MNLSKGCFPSSTAMTLWPEPSHWGTLHYTCRLMNYCMVVCCLTFMLWHLFPPSFDQDAREFGFYYPREEKRPPQYSPKSRLSWQRGSRGCYICCCKLLCSVKVRNVKTCERLGYCSSVNRTLYVMFCDFRDFAAGICNKVSEMIQGNTWLLGLKMVGQDTSIGRNMGHYYVWLLY